MPAIDYITIKGFKSISNIEKLELRPINIIIGPNGSGKSNFIGVFSFLHAIKEKRLQEYIAKAGGANKVLHFGSKISPKMQFHVSFEQEVNQYFISLEPTAEDSLYIKTELVYYWDKQRYQTPYTTGLLGEMGEAGISNSKLERVAEYVQMHLAKWRLYHFHDTSSLSPLKRTGDINDNNFLRSDGSNLAPFLYFLKAKYKDNYNLIVNAIRRIAPFFEDFILSPSNLNQNKIRLEWKNKSSDEYFDSASLSDGTLRFIALATLFLQPERYIPSVILVDEPELGLHPYAITMIANMIKSASINRQVIVSTQSPILLDHFNAEDVLVANLVDGSTNLKRLDPDILDEWISEFSLGQLWEKNEIGGRP